MTIQSRLSVDQCISELKRLTVPQSIFGTMSAPVHSVICQLKGNKFRLREKRSYNNPYARFFYGEFRSLGNGTEISGEFRLRLVTKMFLGFWFGFLLLMIVIILGRLLAQVAFHRIAAYDGSGVVLLGAFGISVFGYGILRFSRWLARNEEIRLIQFINDIFSDKSAPMRHATEWVALRNPPPERTMWRVIFCFTLLGLISMSGGISGVSSIQVHASNSPSSQNMVAITHFHSEWDEAFAGFNGLFLLLTAFGVWKRLRVAWKMGFAIFALGAVNCIFTIWGDSQNIAQRDSPLVFVISGTLGAFAVGSYWVYWWYKKRTYFNA